MDFDVGDKLMLKTPEGGSVEVMATWPSFAAALEADPGGLGPLAASLPKTVNREQGFYSLFFPSRGGCLLVGEEQIGNMVEKKLSEIIEDEDLSRYIL